MAEKKKLKNKNCWLTIDLKQTSDIGLRVKVVRFRREIRTKDDTQEGEANQSLMRNKRNQPSLYISKQVGGGRLCFFRIRGKKRNKQEEKRRRRKKSTSGMRKENKNRRSCMEGRRNK